MGTRAKVGPPVAASVSAVLAAVGMGIGAVGPWARTPVISFDGWAGIGLPIAVVAFVALVLVGLNAFVPRRLWLVLTMLLAAVVLILAIVIWLLESVLAHAGTALSLLIAHGTHRDLLTHSPVTLAWGVPLMVVTALALMLLSVGGLFGRFPTPGLHRGGRGRTRGEDAAPAVRYELDEDAWLREP